MFPNDTHKLNSRDMLEKISNPISRIITSSQTFSRIHAYSHVILAHYHEYSQTFSHIHKHSHEYSIILAYSNIILAHYHK